MVNRFRIVRWRRVVNIGRKYFRRLGYVPRGGTPPIHPIERPTKLCSCPPLPQETRVRGADETVPDRIPVQGMPARVPGPVRPDLRHGPENVQQRLFLGDGELPVPGAGQQTVSRRLRSAHRRAQKLLVLIVFTARSDRRGRKQNALQTTRIL